MCVSSFYTGVFFSAVEFWRDSEATDSIEKREEMSECECEEGWCRSGGISNQWGAREALVDVSVDESSAQLLLSSSRDAHRIGGLRTPPMHCNCNCNAHSNQDNCSSRGARPVKCFALHCEDKSWNHYSFASWRKHACKPRSYSSLKLWLAHRVGVKWKANSVAKNISRATADPGHRFCAQSIILGELKWLCTYSFETDK